MNSNDDIEVKNVPREIVWQTYSLDSHESYVWHSIHYDILSWLRDLGKKNARSLASSIVLKHEDGD